MPNLLEQGATWLDDQRHQHLTRSVTYNDGTTQVLVQATIGRTVFEQTDEYGVVRKIESRDYLIRTSDFATKPKRGDIIMETEGTSTFSYEVVSPGGEPEFRYSDPYRKAYRIHTKLVATT